MNVRCKICCLGRIFETADRLQQIKRKSSKSRRESLLRVEQIVSTTPSQASGNHAMELSTIGHVNSGWRWKSTFDFTQIVNNYASKRRVLSHRLKFVFHFSQKLHIQFRKNFHSVLLCSVGSNYCKKVGC